MPQQRLVVGVLHLAIATTSRLRRHEVTRDGEAIDQTLGIQARAMILEPIATRILQGIEIVHLALLEAWQLLAALLQTTHLDGASEVSVEDQAPGAIRHEVQARQQIPTTSVQEVLPALALFPLLLLALASVQRVQDDHAVQSNSDVDNLAQLEGCKRTNRQRALESKRNEF